MDNFYKDCPAKMSDGRFLNDSRTSHRRELYNMNQNGFVRADDFRHHLQSNGDDIMNTEWTLLRKNNSCTNYPCFHNYPTRPTPGMLNEEMKAYNDVKTGKSSNTPACEKFDDYRLTYAKGSK